MPNDASFLGRGWAFPPSFTAGGREVETEAGAEDVHQSLRILLSTRPGERVMREDFGCDLESLLFEELDQGLINGITRLVTDAIVDHEPRVDLDRVDVRRSEAGAAAGTTLLISIDYTVRGTNSRYNMVYPFYLTEAAVPRV